MPAPALPHRRRKAPARNERGVALLIVVIAITLLTVVATDFAYNSRVDLQLAANQRDEVRAYSLARSGMGLSRLLLRFQKQMDSLQIPGLNLPGAGGGGGGLNLQLWKMARVDCHMLKGMVPEGGGEGGEAASDPKFQFDEEAPAPQGGEGAAEAGPRARSFGSFEGCFLASISAEEEKLNVARLMAPGADAYAAALRLLDMLNDKRFEFLWEKEDANGVRVNPADVVINLRDWADEDDTQSALSLQTPATPFAQGFADEKSPYDRYEPRYQPKNANFDSLDELYRVHGVTDRFMAAFRDRLTVFTDPNRPPSINTDDPMMLYLAILSATDPLRPDPRLQNPVFVQDLIGRIRQARLFSFMGMSVTDFLQLLSGAGLAVRNDIGQNVAQNRFLGDKSQTFTVTSVGEAGSVQKRLTAVVRLDDGLGKLLYWREE